MKPNYLNVTYTPGDVTFDRLIAPAQALEALALARKPMKLPRFELPFAVPSDDGSLALGEPGTCHSSSEWFIENFGGEVVSGWLVLSLVTRSGVSRMGLMGHSVWRRGDGMLCEVTDTARFTLGAAVGFVPHKAVKFGSQVQIWGVDHGNAVIPSCPEDQIAGQFNVKVPVLNQKRRDGKDREKEYRAARRLLNSAAA